MNLSPATAKERQQAVEQVLALRAAGAYRTLSVVAPQYGVSAGTLRRWMQQLGVPDEPNQPDPAAAATHWRPLLADTARHTPCNQPLIPTDGQIRPPAYRCPACRHRPAIPADTAEAAVYLAIQLRVPHLANRLPFEGMLALISTVRIDDRGNCTTLTWRLSMPAPRRHLVPQQVRTDEPSVGHRSAIGPARSSATEIGHAPTGGRHLPSATASVLARP